MASATGDGAGGAGGAGAGSGSAAPAGAGEAPVDTSKGLHIFWGSGSPPGAHATRTRACLHDALPRGWCSCRVVLREARLTGWRVCAGRGSLARAHLCQREAAGVQLTPAVLRKVRAYGLRLCHACVESVRQRSCSRLTGCRAVLLGGRRDTKQPWYLKLNPRGLVPMLVHEYAWRRRVCLDRGLWRVVRWWLHACLARVSVRCGLSGIAIAESLAILMYLERYCPTVRQRRDTMAQWAARAQLACVTRLTSHRVMLRRCRCCRPTRLSAHGRCSWCTSPTTSARSQAR